MTRARLTWKTRAWSEGALVEQLPALRANYGDQVAALVELTRAMLSEQRHKPSAQDVKRTLQAIADEPDAVDLSRLDADSTCELLRFAWRELRSVDLAALTPDQLARCAALARASYTRASGRPHQEALVLPMVRELLHFATAHGMRSQRRDVLLHDALKACHVQADTSSKNVQRLVTKARRLT